MFLLDTNVVSEFRRLLRGKGDPGVVAWARSVSGAEIWISVITLYETEVGVRKLERKDVRQGAMLRRWMNEGVLEKFRDRILVLDERIALTAARLNVPDPRPINDSLIAATAIVHGLTIATRNIGDFQGLPVGLINPWEV